MKIEVGGLDQPGETIFSTTYTPSDSDSTKIYVQFIKLDSFEGTFDLAGKNWYDVVAENKGVFVYIMEESGNTTYFQRSGTIIVSDEEDDGWSWEKLGVYSEATMSAEFTDVVLDAVTVGIDNHSTPDESGACLRIKNTTLTYSESDGWSIL